MSDAVQESFALSDNELVQRRSVTQLAPGKHFQTVEELNAWVESGKPPKDSGHRAFPKYIPDNLPF